MDKYIEVLQKIQQLSMQREFMIHIPNGLSKESKVSISNYVAEMNDQEYSRLEKLVKLYGNQLSSEDETIKQINKHLVETVRK